ncbi:MAG: glycosyltransferase family A protein [Pseudomonadota bacterium]
MGLNSNITGRVDVTIVISTKDRSADLTRCLQSVVRQNGRPEVIVIDDGSSDGTAQVVQQYPEIIYVQHARSAGLILRRNEGAELASRSIIISLDDDAEFSSDDCVMAISSSFVHPDIAAVAIPCIEPNKDNRVVQVSGDYSRSYVTDAFMGTAYAIRREVFLSLGGFRQMLIRQGEEREFAMRLMNSGKFVGYADAPPIIHYEQRVRDWARQGYFGRRNDILFAWHVVPLLFLPIHLLVTTFKGLIFLARTPPRCPMLMGLAAGWGMMLPALRERTAVSPSVYRLSRRLRKGAVLTVEEARSYLGLPVV